MSFSARIARIAGIDVKVHLTFLIIVLMSAFQWGGSYGALGAGFGVLLTVLLFTSVVLHELGHALVARAFGVPVRDILLLPIGGVATLEGKPKTPTHELLIALAGPAVNVLLVGLLVLAGVAWKGVEGFLALPQALGAAPGPSAETLLTLLISSNVVLALFNLLPALPMDGGRVLRAALSWVMPAAKATRVAAVVARILAVGMFGAAVAFGNPMLGIIALFVFLGAGAESAEAGVDEALAGITAGAAVSPHAVKLQPNQTLVDAVRLLTQVPQSAFAVEHFGRLLGVLTRTDILKAVREAGPDQYVTGLMRRELHAVASGVSLSAARQLMLTQGTPFLAVYEGDVFLGLLTEVELAQQFAVARALRGKKPDPGSGPSGGRPVEAPRS
jgi:Zn-dependent protease/CBS domain-containing protein